MRLIIDSKIRNTIIGTICFLFILLFVYAAISKLIDFQNFRIQIAQSPLLTAFARFISVLVIVLELLIAAFLSFPRTRKIGLFGSYTLMLLFTIYIVTILNFSPFVPCSCGGVLEDLNWQQHLYFNIIFTILALIALYLHVRKPPVSPFYITVRVSGLTIFSVVLMASLFVLSKDISTHRNSFIRNFPPFPAKRTNLIDLKFNSYYFAGSTNARIFLGNATTPALITVVDSALKRRERIQIDIQDTIFRFNNVQLRVRPPYFYIYDGTVPCLYKGNLEEKKAILQKGKIPGFTKAEIIDSNNIIVRTISPKRENLLSLVNFTTSDKSDRPELLQKQIDGIFDTDGTMNFDPANKLFTYLYYYRNQYIVADGELNLIHRGNTIDTTTKARIQIEEVKSKKHRKFSAPPYRVNRISTSYRGLLFVNSALRGKYDTKSMWENANYIDVYDIRTTSYLMSFYVYKIDGGNIHDMVITDTHLYVIISNNLISYKLSEILTNKFHKKITGRYQE